MLCLVLLPRWLLLRREKAGHSLSRSRLPAWVPDLAVLLLCLTGLLLFPVHLRSPLLHGTIRSYGYINYPCLLAVITCLLCCRRWTVVEAVCFAVWFSLSVPLAASGDKIPHVRFAAAFCQTVVPLFLVLHRMDPSSRRKLLRRSVLVFDGFVLLLLVLGIEEYLSHKALLTLLRDWLAGMGLKTNEFDLYLEDYRFGFIWGHPLTNALIFNSFFALNMVYLRASGSRIPAPLLFVPAVAGVLLCSSKTGIAVCFLLLLISCWRYKKWLLLVVPVLLVMYFFGAFNDIITRFTSTTLTTERAEQLGEYLASGINPLRWFSGYGPNGALAKSSPVYIYNDAFEFSALMFAYSYGILFAVLHIGGLFAYVTWRFLRKRQWLPWLCFSLVFAEINTYNGYSLRNQDVCFFFCLLVMLMLNIADDSGGTPREWPPERTVDA